MVVMGRLRNGHNVKVFCVGGDWLKELFSTHDLFERSYVGDDWPINSRIVNVRYLHDIHMVEMLVESPEFDFIIDGEEIPRVFIAAHNHMMIRLKNAIRIQSKEGHDE